MIMVTTAVLLGASAQAATPAEPYAKELKLAQSLALRGGAIAMRMRGKVKTEYKDRQEPVTKADRDISALIVGELQHAFPEDVVVTEESKQDWGRVRFAKRVWYVDPIDGTADYIAGRVGFAVHIGLVVRDGFSDPGRAVLGVVYQPANGRLYYAAPGIGARIRDAKGDRPLVPSSRRQPESLRLLVSKAHRSKQIDALKLALGITRERGMGSIGVKFGHIANGESDLALAGAKSIIHPWDMAAPDAILTAAGGRVTTVDGQSLPYHRIFMPGGHVASNGVAHDAVLARLRPYARPGLFVRLRNAVTGLKEIARARR
jgi:3'(2'), 5'-bisphosphate nucleotidase